jgi:ATP-dependent DNA helicase RecQ
VVHVSTPRSPEHYQQEAGRAGRDGLPAECVLLYSSADFLRWRRMLEANGEFTPSAQALLRDMDRYASGVGCRHRALVEYFGEPYGRSECGACDWCLKELDPVPDATTLARKILSGVARVQQSWGIGHITDVLVGRATEKVIAAGHTELSTFALLRHERPATLRGYIEQLIDGGFLQRIGDPYPVLRLTSPGKALMRGESVCSLYREVQPPARTQRRRGADAPGENNELFDALRQVRLRLARERGVPPYVIFHDTTLRDMAERQPKTLEQFRLVYGVGAVKAADFGDAFLEAVRAFQRPD